MSFVLYDPFIVPLLPCEIVLHPAGKKDSLEYIAVMSQSGMLQSCMSFVLLYSFNLSSIGNLCLELCSISAATVLLRTQMHALHQGAVSGKPFTDQILPLAVWKSAKFSTDGMRKLARPALLYVSVVSRRRAPFSNGRRLARKLGKHGNHADVQYICSLCLGASKCLNFSTDLG